MAQRYRLTCVNNTDQSYHFGLYQDFPNSPGLKSVAWQVRGVPARGQMPSTADIDWTLEYGVAICRFDQNGQTYTGRQIASAELGKSYQVIYCDSDIPSINQTPTGNSVPGQIPFKNDTDRPIDMGFTMAGEIIAAQKVQGGETIIFEVHATSYYVACYHGIQLGQLVDSAIELGPVTLKYRDGYTKATVEAAIVAGQRVLNDPKNVR